MVGGGGLPPHHKAPSTAAYNSWLYMRSTEWSRRRATSAQPSLFTSRGNCSIIGRRGAAKCPHYQLHTPVSPNPKSSPITKVNPHSPIGKRVHEKEQGFCGHCPKIFCVVYFVLFQYCAFLSDPGVPGVRSMGLGLCQSVQEVLQT